MKIAKYVLGPIMTNCYVVSDGQEAVIIDPAFRSDKLCGYIEEEKLSVNMILMTHGHFDHIMARPFMPKSTAPDGDRKGRRVYAARRFLQRRAALRPFALRCFRGESDAYAGRGNRRGKHHARGDRNAGHSPGGICFYTPGHLFCGDTLFEGNVGRADLPGGNFDTLVASIKNKLYVLPDDTKSIAATETRRASDMKKKTIIM
jgi:glyoxylase-like metal-dependent hydrolase (beta-lactamase superfamily II)